MRLPVWHLHASVWLILGGIAAAYVVAVRRHIPSSPREAVERRRRSLLFASGMAVLWIGADWPVHDLAETYLYTAHMFQHMLFTLVAAPLLVAGIPAWMWRRLLAPRVVGAAFSFLTRPIVALAVFNGLLLFTHWPAIVERSVGSEPLHFALHVALFGSAVIAWWPILSPLPERPALTPPVQMMFLFIQSLAPTIPASFLTFGDTLLYPTYGAAPRIWGISALDDQLIAGLLMKIGGGLILWGFIATIFFNWAARERDGWDALALTRVERDVRARVAR